MEVMDLGLNKTEKIIAITFLVLITFLILRKYYAKPSESGYIACPKPQKWDGVRCYNPGPQPKPTIKA